MKTTKNQLFFISNAFKVIEAFKKAEQKFDNREALIEKTGVSWAYSGKLITKLTNNGYLKKTRRGRNKEISLTEQGKKLHKILKDMRKIIWQKTN